MRIIVGFVVITVLVSLVPSSLLRAQPQARKPFTVEDDIGLYLFLEHGNDSGSNVRFSPNGEYFVVFGERGRLDVNKVEDSLRFYRTKDVVNFLTHPEEARPPLASWTVTRLNEEAPVEQWRWLADSSGVAILENGTGGKHQLVLADLQSRKIEPLTLPSDDVGMFDARDRTHYVYTSTDALEVNKLQQEKQNELHAPALVATGRDLMELLFPEDPTARIPPTNAKHFLWAVVGNKRFQVKHAGLPLVPEPIVLGQGLALAPDGRTAAMLLPVPEVPLAWETLYPPPSPASPFKIHAGHNTAKHFVRVDLETGETQSLADAPISNDAGWWAYGDPNWSSDGSQILLPGTFVKTKDNEPSRPCVALVNVASHGRTCVEMLRSHAEKTESEVHTITGIHFAPINNDRILVSSWGENWSSWVAEYRPGTSGWELVSQHEENSEAAYNGLRVRIQQDLNSAPVLLATFSNSSRVIWDPNPELKNFELGEASVYKWKDREGSEQSGGLYKPPNFHPGVRYPVVIQTHGFIEQGFRPSGTGFGPGYAARELASAGIVVLQLGEECLDGTPGEGECAVSGYESAVKQLVADGIADPEKIGIIGFSRTCFYVMEALTKNSFPLKAASITDGVMASYFQYMQAPGPGGDAMIGASPFGEGLQLWLKQASGFNLDKVRTPLLVNAEGRRDILFMWEPYAGLRYLKKPVDLILLNTGEHVLTNPAMRMASQGGSVDWFRFWLQGYEDPDPAKAEQYKRWRELKKLQAEQEKNSIKSQASSN